MYKTVVYKMTNLNLLFAICIFFVLQIKTCIADDNSIFLFNDIKNCKENEYFNTDYLKCKVCESNLNLTPSRNRK